jgi:hypothetical protein
MADVPASGPSFVIQSGDTFYLGNGDETFVSTMLIQMVADAFTGSVTVKARAQGTVPASASVAPVAVAYLPLNVGGTAGDGSLSSSAITGSAMLLVPATGQTIVLDCTSYTEGTLTVYFVPCAGAAA